MNAQEKMMRGLDEDSSVVGRVLNGPCASGHGGQVISRENSHGSKRDLTFGSFQSVKAH